MQNKPNIHQSLALYGINTKQQSKKSIQQKIINMYELLQIKTTQNLLLRKDNDDIKLQIQTIKDLFMNSQIDINNFQKEKVSFENNKEFIHNSDKKKIQQKKKLSNFNQASAPLYNQLNVQNHEIQYDYNQCQNNHPDEYDQEISDTLSFQNKNLNIQKSKKQGGFKLEKMSSFQKGQGTQSSKTQQNTTRKINNNENKNKKNMDLNDKIQFLMRQNEIILKRMNQIQVNFIKGEKQNEYQRTRKKNCDDKQTNISSNITSIHNIWHRKQGQKEGRSNFGHNRNHHSTNNLRTYSITYDR